MAGNCVGQGSGSANAGDRISAGARKMAEFLRGAAGGSPRAFSFRLSSYDGDPVNDRAPESPWSPESWRTRPQAQEVAYPDGAALEAAVARLRTLPPLVTSWEIERLRKL